jgi:hypothetical protein
MTNEAIRNPQSAIPLRGTQAVRNHTIRHFALHRIRDVELRVISDIEEGVIGITEVEEAVLRQYAGQPDWPHRVVSLFVLSDLSPLQRQLVATAKLPPGGVEGLGLRPVVNLYDLADLGVCHVFVNQTAMAKEGYWGDRLAETTLLAHEHGHPLAENVTTRALRRLSVTLELICREPVSTTAARNQVSDGISNEWEAKLLRLLQLLADKLCAYAPREVFTNDVVLRSGFSDALYHLDLLNVQNAAKGVLARPALVAGLAAEPALTATGRAAFLAVADLKAHLDLALEIASFRRLGRADLAIALEQVLEREVFPHLVPEVAVAYTMLSSLYRYLPAEMPPAELIAFAERVVAALTHALLPYEVLLDARTDMKPAT